MRPQRASASSEPRNGRHPFMGHPSHLCTSSAPTCPALTLCTSRNSTRACVSPSRTHPPVPICPYPTNSPHFYTHPAQLNTHPVPIPAYYSLIRTHPLACAPPARSPRSMRAQHTHTHMKPTHPHEIADTTDMDPRSSDSYDASLTLSPQSRAFNAQDSAMRAKLTPTQLTAHEATCDAIRAAREVGTLLEKKPVTLAVTPPTERYTWYTPMGDSYTYKSSIIREARTFQVGTHTVELYPDDTVNTRTGAITRGEAGLAAEQEAHATYIRTKAAWQSPELDGSMRRQEALNEAVIALEAFRPYAVRMSEYRLTIERAAREAHIETEDPRQALIDSLPEGSETGRITCVKPECMPVETMPATTSGIHGVHADTYIRKATSPPMQNMPRRGRERAELVETVRLAYVAYRVDSVAIESPERIAVLDAQKALNAFDKAAAEQGKTRRLVEGTNISCADPEMTSEQHQAAVVRAMDAHRLAGKDEVEHARCNLRRARSACVAFHGGC